MKYFLIVCAALFAWFLIEQIGDLSMWGYVKAILGAGTFYVAIMAGWNKFNGRKWNANLF